MFEGHTRPQFREFLKNPELIHAHLRLPWVSSLRLRAAIVLFQQTHIFDLSCHRHLCPTMAPTPRVLFSDVSWHQSLENLAEFRCDCLTIFTSICHRESTLSIHFLRGHRMLVCGVFRVLSAHGCSGAINCLEKFDTDRVGASHAHVRSVLGWLAGCIGLHAPSCFAALSGRADFFVFYVCVWH